MSKEKRKSVGSFSDILGELRTRAEILDLIESDPHYIEWRGFSREDQESILLFLEGKQSLQILSDKFFRHVFKPDDYPERIESLVSAILGEPVKIVQILSREGTAITESGSQVIMDIIVKTSTGAIVNVEMQRIGYYFPGERSGCYTADMIMRQYGKCRSEKGDKFSYRDLKPVTLIVLMEKSSNEFAAVEPEYIHKKITNYSSGAVVTVLENVVYVSLDTFKKQMHNTINNELDAWLAFFTFERPDEVMSLVQSHPEFIELYKDIAEFRKSPGEVIGMFSEALRIMDRNTTKYMIEDMKRQYDDAKARYDDVKSQYDDVKSQYDDVKSQYDDVKSQYDDVKSQYDDVKSQYDDVKAQLEESQRENAELKAMLAEINSKQ